MRAKHKLTKRERQAYIVKFKDLQGDTDTEHAHAEADDLIVEILNKTGHQDIVAEYEKVAKWYS